MGTGQNLTKRVKMDKTHEKNETTRPRPRSTLQTMAKSGLDNASSFICNTPIKIALTNLSEIN